MRTAADVMTTKVVTIPADATVEEAIATLIERGISGAPVMDGDQLVGIVSEYQLLEIVFDQTVKYDRIDQFMTRGVVTVDEHDSLIDVASLFIVRRIRRVPVLRGSQLVGMITRRDLLKASLGRYTALASK